MRWAESLGMGVAGGWKNMGPWVQLRPGVQKLTLSLHEDGAEVALLKYDPGAEVPPHFHEGEEHILMLEGSQSDALGEIQAGAGRVNGRGTTHAVSSQSGCLLLICWEKPVRFL